MYRPNIIAFSEKLWPSTTQLVICIAISKVYKQIFQCRENISQMFLKILKLDSHTKSDQMLEGNVDPFYGLFLKGTMSQDFLPLFLAQKTLPDPI